MKPLNVDDHLNEAATTTVSAWRMEHAPKAPIGFAALLDQGRWSTFQKALLVLLSLAVVLDGFNNQVIGFALPAILKDWGGQQAEFAPVLSGGLIGMAVGTFLGGVGGDRWGRKPSLIASVLLFGAATALTSLAHTPLEVGVLRFLSGMGIGGALPNAAALAAEFTPSRRRPLAVSCAIVCVPLGGMLGGLLAAEILPTLGWRALFLMTGAAPIAIGLALWLLLPESPTFLARRGRAEELARFLRRCGVAAEAGTLFAMPPSTAPGAPKPGVRALFQPLYARDTALLWLMFFFSQAAAYLLFSWLPTLLADHGFSLNVSSNGLTMNNLGGVIGALAGARAIEAFGSRRTMIFLSVGAVAAAALLYWIGIAPGGSTILLIGLLAVQGFFLNGVMVNGLALTSHIYPSEVRATGVGMALAVGRAGGILSAFTGLTLLAGTGGSFFVALAGVMAVVAVGLSMVRRHIPPSNGAGV